MYAILAVVLAILAAILFSPIKAEIGIKGKKTDLTVYVAGVRVLNRALNKKDESKAENTSPLEKTAEVEKNAVSLGEKISRFKDVFSDTVKLIRKYVEIDSVNLSIDVGTSDAAVTAISVGALWGAIYGLIGVLGSVVYIKKHNVQINPDYTKSVFYLDGNCIFSSRLVYIIIIAITILVKKQSRKGKEE